MALKNLLLLSCCIAGAVAQHAPAFRAFRGYGGPTTGANMDLPLNGGMFTLHINGNFSAIRTENAISDGPSPEIGDGYPMTSKVVDAHTRINESQYLTINGADTIRIDRIVPNGITPETLFLSSRGDDTWKLTRTVAWSKDALGSSDAFVPASMLCSIAERTITTAGQNDGIEFPTKTFDLLSWEAGFERPWPAFRGTETDAKALFGAKLGYPFSNLWWGPLDKEVATEWKRLPNTKDKKTGDTLGHWESVYETIGDTSSGSWSTRLDGKLAGVPVSFSGSDYEYMFNRAGSTRVSANVTFTPVELKFGDGKPMTAQDLFPMPWADGFPTCPPGIDLCRGRVYC